LEFARQAPEICLDCASTAQAYNFQILLAELHVKMHTLNPEIVANHNKQFAKQKAQIPLKECVVRSAQIPSGSTTFMSQTLMNGKLPTAIVVGMVSGSAMNGALNRDPWNFQNFGLTSITLSSDNDPTMTKTFDVDFKSNTYLLGYQSLFKAVGRRKNGNFISRIEYPTGNTLFLYDLQESIASELHAAKTGQLKVRPLPPIS